MKILVFALSGIGDALMFTPAIKKLREIYPDSVIDVMVMFKGNEELFKNMLDISKVHYIDFMNQSKIKSLFQVLAVRGKYDASINVYPSNRKEYNLISFLVGAKKRAAVRYLRVDKSEMGYLNNVTIEENDSLHNVEENIMLVEKLSGEVISDIPNLEFPLSATDTRNAFRYYHERQILEDDLVIGFHAGCATLKNHINRRWAPENFAELGKQLIEKHNAQILVFGGPEEDELKKNIVDQIGSENAVAVQTDSLPQSVAYMKRCNVFVTNDSALMHIAASLQLKTVALIGPTNTNYIYPWKTDHKIISLNLDCAPCFYYSPKPLTCTREDVEYKCIKELPVQQVYEAVKSFLP